MSDRGMKKWAPYSSLIEQATCLEEMRYERNKVEKPVLTEDKKEEINLILQQYKGGPIKVKFWADGYFYYIDKPIKKIDLENRCLVYEKGKLMLSSIIDIESNNDFYF